MDDSLSQASINSRVCYLVEMDRSAKDEVSAAKPKCKRTRKRTRTAMNVEEVEIQRITHIAVERNRRRQMNSHLHSLRSLMPPSYVRRGDQASVIEGAIEFVKKMEQLLQSQSLNAVEQPCLAASSNLTDMNGNGNRTSPVRRSKWHMAEGVRVIDCHVNVKVECEWRPRLLVNAVAGLEEMRLTVLHLNITSSSSLFLLSFNLKIEDDCKVQSADKIAEAVEHMFNNFMG